MQDRDVPASQDTAEAERRQRGSLGPTKIFLFFFFYYFQYDKKAGLPQVRARMGIYRVATESDLLRLSGEGRYEEAT